MYINTYTWNLENGIDDLICKTERDTDVENKHIDTKEGKGGWDELEFGIGIYINTLLTLCIKQIPRDGGAWWAAIYGVTQSRT